MKLPGFMAKILENLENKIRLMVGADIWIRIEGVEKPKLITQAFFVGILRMQEERKQREAQKRTGQK